MFPEMAITTGYDNNRRNDTHHRCESGIACYICRTWNQSKNIIDQDEKEALKKLSSELLSLTAEALEIAKLKDELIEVICNEEEEVSNS